LAKIATPALAGYLTFAVAYVIVGMPFAAAVGLAAAVLGDTSLGDDRITAWVLFWTLLPIANAAFDWLSWQISRWLGARLLAASEDPKRTRWRRLQVYVVDVTIDIAFALAFLVGLAWTIPQVIEGWNAFVRWMGDEPSLRLADYLCNAAREPLAEGFWAVGMLFSTLLPTAAHLLFLVFAPIFWLMVWLFGAHQSNRARAAHLALGTRPPKADLIGWSQDDIDQIRATPADYGDHGLGEEAGVFQGKLNPQTVHKVALQLRVWRPLYYAAASGLVLYAIWQLSALATASWRPLPQLLLWVASDFDYGAVRACFPAAPPTAPLETLAI
jgi:hypothetical protein